MLEKTKRAVQSGWGGVVRWRRVGFVKRLSVLVISLLALAVTVRAQEAQVRGADELPARKIVVGIYINGITQLNLKQSEFVADFYIWFRWTGEDESPYSSFEIVNGRVESKDDGPRLEFPDGVHYASGRVRAVIRKNWDLAAYPHDSQKLTICIEDNGSEEQKLFYVADLDNTGVSPEVEVPGYRIVSAESGITTHTYSTNYGDTTLPKNAESKYSRFTTSVHLERPDYGFFLKLCWAVLISVLIALLSLWIRPGDLDPRFGLPVGALFASVASEYIIASSMPDTGVLSLADRLHIASVFYILLILSVSVVSLRWFNAGRIKASERLDMVSFYLFLGSYFLVCGTLAWAAG